MNIINFGAIDIGSNAARLLISSVNIDDPEPKLRKNILLRIPLRLGEDVFSKGKIGDYRLKKFVRMMKAFKQLIKIYEVRAYKIYATSAMREAANSRKAVETISNKTGLKIEVIDGKTEAGIIVNSRPADYPFDKKYLYVDVGGGSTELTLIENGKLNESKSFNVGTLRILAGKVKTDEWVSMKKWLESVLSKNETVEMIGVGGNINKLYRLAELKKNEQFTSDKLKEVYCTLKQFTVEDRMKKYDMRPDRADVIIPAAEIFMFIADESNIFDINVPTVGLADGMIGDIFNDFKLAHSINN